MPADHPLLAVPNVSEGRDPDTIAAIGAALTQSGAARLLDVHSDPDHHRTVYTLVGTPGTLAHALLDGAREAIARIDLTAERGVHPHVGALDVAPIVHLDSDGSGAAFAEALVLGDELGRQLGLPVFLYGALAAGRSRAQLRSGGIAGLAQRMAAGEQTPDFGPRTPHPTAGATLVAARPPLAAFNVTLEPPADLETARRIAGAIREGGPEGLPGVRAIGLRLATSDGVAQVSCNVEDPLDVPLARVVEAIAAHAKPRAAEIVGLVPRGALVGFPDTLDLGTFEPSRHVLEEALGFQ